MIWVIILLGVVVIALLVIIVKIVRLIEGHPVRSLDFSFSLIKPVNQIHISQCCCGYKSYLELSRGDEIVKYNLALNEEESVQIFTVPELSCCLILRSMYGFKVIRLDLPRINEPLTNIKASVLLREEQIRMPVRDYLKDIQRYEPDETEKKILANSQTETVARYHICKILNISPDGEELWVNASTPEIGFGRVFDGGDLRFCIKHHYAYYYCNLKDLTLRPAPEPEAENDDLGPIFHVRGQSGEFL